MLRNIAILFLALSLSIGGAACSKKKAKANLTDRWTGVTDNVTAEFKPDGTYTFIQNGATTAGNYVFNADNMKLTLMETGKSPIDVTVSTLTDDKLVLAFGGSNNIEFKDAD